MKDCLIFGFSYWILSKVVVFFASGLLCDNEGTVEALKPSETISKSRLRLQHTRRDVLAHRHVLLANCVNWHTRFTLDWTFVSAHSDTTSCSSSQTAWWQTWPTHVKPLFAPPTSPSPSSLLVWVMPTSQTCRFWMEMTESCGHQRVNQSSGTLCNLCPSETSKRSALFTICHLLTLISFSTLHDIYSCSIHCHWRDKQVAVCILACAPHSRFI